MTSTMVAMHPPCKVPYLWGEGEYNADGGGEKGKGGREEVFRTFLFTRIRTKDILFYACVTAPA